MGSESTPRSQPVDVTAADETHVDAPATPNKHGADLPQGTIVGDYQIERKLGHGGMGAVYEAVHPVIEKRVAIKVLPPEMSRNEEAVERFKSEARAVNRIRHPSIVDVFGYGTTEDGRCFLVMELLDGESLGSRLQYDAPTIAEACDILISITHALDAAHASGIVHRDLKPDNVFLVEGKHVKLLDFGIAKLSGRAEGERAATDYTQPGQAMGTPRYIAPEQARGDAVDGRTDIYSLGVMAFELLVGRLPFVGDNAMELIAKHITLPPPKPSDLAPTLAPVADQLLLQMLDKEPINRPTLATVREKLDEIRAPWVTSVTSLAAAKRPPVETAPVVVPITQPLPSLPARKPTFLIAAILGALVVGALAFAIVRLARPEPDATPATEAPAARIEPDATVAPPLPTPTPTPPAAPVEIEVKPPPVPASVPIRKPKPPRRPVTVKPATPDPAPVVTPPPPASTPPPPTTTPPQPQKPENRDGLMRPSWQQK